MKWKVVVTRTESKQQTFVVVADTEDEANAAAIEEASDQEWSRGEAEYEVETVTPA